jgi:hypothetical protein
VLLVKRDVFPEEPEKRSGKPQAFHLHGLLPRGKLILDRLFPGLADNLLAHGTYATQSKNVRMVMRYSDIHFQIPDKDTTWSRALLEWAMRQRVPTLPNLGFMK